MAPFITNPAGSHSLTELLRNSTDYAPPRAEGLVI